MSARQKGLWAVAETLSGTQKYPTDASDWRGVEATLALAEVGLPLDRSCHFQGCGQEMVLWIGCRSGGAGII